MYVVAKFLLNFGKFWPMVHTARGTCDVRCCAAPWQVPGNIHRLKWLLKDQVPRGETVKRRSAWSRVSLWINPCYGFIGVFMGIYVDVYQSNISGFILWFMGILVDLSIKYGHLWGIIWIYLLSNMGGYLFIWISTTILQWEKTGASSLVRKQGAQRIGGYPVRSHIVLGVHGTTVSVLWFHCCWTSPPFNS